MFELPFRSALEYWSSARRFNALSAEDRRIVFYAEDGDSWPHFEPIVRQLTESMGRNICYVTSSRSDPMLQANSPRIRTFCIGEGAVRTSWFMSLKADVCVMTMPDLQTFHIKRSRQWPVHYVYAFHSIVSTHMIYRKAAFDAFDTILCVGPHHVREIRATEAAYGLPAKQLVEYGYGRLDTMLAGIATPQCSHASSADRHVLVAPSWGPNGLLETCGEQCVAELLKSGLRVTVRPHPMTRRKRPDCIAAIERAFGNDPRLKIETGVADFSSLAAADVMVSDFSGAALEFAFACERPVLFVDVPRKVNNPEYGTIGCEPLEVSIREQIGRVVAPADLASLGTHARELCEQADTYRSRIRQARTQAVYNVGSSGRAAAEAIASVADRAASGTGEVHELCGIGS